MRVLVGYASVHASTREIAERIDQITGGTFQVSSAIDLNGGTLTLSGAGDFTGPWQLPRVWDHCRYWCF